MFVKTFHVIIALLRPRHVATGNPPEDDAVRGMDDALEARGY